MKSGRDITQCTITVIRSMGTHKIGSTTYRPIISIFKDPPSLSIARQPRSITDLCISWNIGTTYAHKATFTTDSLLVVPVLTTRPSEQIGSKCMRTGGLTALSLGLDICIMGQAVKCNQQ